MRNLNEQNNSIITYPGVLDFVKYAAAYCALVEPQSTPHWSRESVVECRKLLAWVYATGLSLPDLSIDPFIQLERVVNELEYDLVRKRIEHILGEQNLFLNAQMDEMKYSDIPVSVSTAEILADIYQALADTVWVFRDQVEQNMHQAIAEVKYSLEYEWGTLLLAATRQLHDLHIDPYFEIGSDDVEDMMAGFDELNG